MESSPEVYQQPEVPGRLVYIAIQKKSPFVKMRPDSPHGSGGTFVWTPWLQAAKEREKQTIDEWVIERELHGVFDDLDICR